MGPIDTLIQKIDGEIIFIFEYSEQPSDQDLSLLYQPKGTIFQELVSEKYSNEQGTNLKVFSIAEVLTKQSEDGNFFIKYHFYVNTPTEYAWMNN